MIRLMLMALGAYTLYRMYVPLEGETGPRALLSDTRGPDRGTRRVRAGGNRS
ncbi:MAG: hypothetical protein ACT6QU_17950 [Aliihoeflea sp.]|jgi:hypothetical protein|uniref:hypothetical protein n=1 Tax=unclassified Aliihoeflea TaxID=2628764 RepID=UPI0004B56982|nr:hypothetical protein [Aliihoeflea sp. 2WW]